MTDENDSLEQGNKGIAGLADYLRVNLYTSNAKTIRKHKAWIAAIEAQSAQIDALAAENARLRELVASPPIKPLVWRGSAESGWWKASDALMLYRIRFYDGMSKPYRVSMDGFVTEWECGTLEAAKAAARQDYESRIRAALATPPSP